MHLAILRITSSLKYVSSPSETPVNLQTKKFYIVKALSNPMAESQFPRELKMALSLLLIIAGFSMYWVWGLLYGSWNIFQKEFIGVYSIVIVLFGFGILGLILSLKGK